MEQGILLVIVSLILIVVGGVILIAFSLSFISTLGAAQFGGKCYFSFLGYTFLHQFDAIESGANSLLGMNLNTGITASEAQVQSACIQNSNINAHDTSSFAQELYSKAASCFNLFQGSNANTGENIAKDLGNLFECYTGKVINSGGAGVTYDDIINYIDANYPNNGGPLQISFLTNDSNGAATYSNPHGELFNGSNYIIEYFRYPYYGVSPNSLPSGCPISFLAQCEYVSTFNQPASNTATTAPGSLCTSTGEINVPVNSTVSSLSSGEPFGANSQSAAINVCGNFLIPFCGKLINTMVGSQNRVFVCITNSSTAT